MDEKLSEKVIWNAIVAYLMIFVSGLFLFNKDNKYINNDFVKSHTKSALILHTWFLITYIVFISNSLFSGIRILWLWLNNIIAIVISCCLLALLILWMYKAKNGLEFGIWKTISLSKQKAILDIDWDWDISEKEKLTIILSFVPFIWFLNFAKNKENKTIIEATRLSIFISLIITLLYIFWYNNLVNLLSLIYIISVTFIWVNLFARDELVQIKLPTIFSPKNTYIWLITTKNYLKSYFTNNDFVDFSKLYKNVSEKINTEKNALEKELQIKKDLRIHKVLIYIPIINLLFIFIKNTKYSLHIKNWIIITFLLIINITLYKFSYLDLKFSLLLLFPILFWMSYTTNTLAYKVPIIYDIYEFISKIFWLLKFWAKDINKRRKEDNVVKLKVK